MDTITHKAKFLTFVVILSTLFFLILHRIELPFQEYPNKALLYFIRFILFIPLLYCFFKGHSWARWVILLISIIAFFTLSYASLMNSNMLADIHIVIILSMLILLLLNIFILFFHSFKR